jgi:phage terminase large subunit GpA-like protein
MLTAELPIEPLVQTAAWCLDLARSPSVRTMSQWAEDTIRLPNGPAAGERYRHRRHPISRVFFDEIDSGRWSRVAASGPTQNGKTLMCYVIPVLYHLFEMGETVIIGLPSLDMANDKWSEDFLPVIEASEYSHLLPATGEGSRGGQVKRSIRFQNGATLRFMTAGGSDKKRSAYTSRVVAITEADGMDESSETSREADKIEQIEARTRAFGRTGKRIYLECTVSIARGRIWQEIKNGSDSRLVRPCPYCGEFVAPEREHLVGWSEAKTSEEAARLAHFICPACEHHWTDADRIEAAKGIRILHAGQEIDRAGNITGEIPETQTLGFRWSAIDNPFTTPGDLGAEEWLAARDRNRENAEKKMRQFVWTLPYEPPEIDLTPLVAEEIEKRTSGLKKGIVPDDAKVITIGIDTGKRTLHWTAIATGETGSRIVEYGKQPVSSDHMGVRKALILALCELAKYFRQGWTTESGKTIEPSQVWIDSGWHEHTDAVYEFCGEINREMGLPIGSEVYRPTKGYGEGQRRMTRYIAPDARRKEIMYIGSEFHIAKVKRNGKTISGVMLVHMNADHWKSELHQRLMMPASEPLAVTLYDAASLTEHSDFCKHLTAEKQVEKYVEGRGEIVIWERIDRNNHWLDSTYSAVCAGEAMVVYAKKKSRPAANERRTLGSMARQ